MIPGGQRVIPGEQRMIPGAARMVSSIRATHASKWKETNATNGIAQVEIYGITLTFTLWAV